MHTAIGAGPADTADGGFTGASFSPQVSERGCVHVLGRKMGIEGKSRNCERGSSLFKQPLVQILVQKRSVASGPRQKACCCLRGRVTSLRQGSGGRGGRWLGMEGAKEAPSHEDVRDCFDICQGEGNVKRRVKSRKEMGRKRRGRKKRRRGKGSRREKKEEKEKTLLLVSLTY